MNRNDKFEAILDESGFSSGVGFLKPGEAIDFDNEDYKSMLIALGYKINDRHFEDTKKLFSKDYARFDFKYDTNKIIYSGAEHTGKPKLPNITVLPNLQTDKGITILGSTMGHQHTQAENGDERQFQEIYEFHGYGGMLLGNKNYTNLHLLSPGKKVSVGTNDNMTIFNFGTYPLITLDYANPNKNEAQKDLEKKLGSFITIAHQDVFPNITFYFSDNYTPKDIEPKHPIQITHANLGQSLLKKIHAHKKHFENQNIEIILGGNLSNEQQTKLKEPLTNLILKRNKTLLRILEIED